MNKREISDLLAERTGITKKQSFRLVEELLDIIMESVSEENNVVLSGFGAFKLVTYSKRKIYNMNTNDYFYKPEHKVLSFSIGNNFKRRISQRQK